jgi:hypothetical protein
MMRPVGRRLFTLCSAVSLLLCVGAGAVWGWSFWRDVYGGSAGMGVLTTTRRGVVTVMRVQGNSDTAMVSVGEPPVFVREVNRWMRDGPARRSVCGVGWGTLIVSTRGMMLHITACSAPLWYALPPLTILPLWDLLRRARRPSALPGVCAACGYDCRATPARCPECGAAVRRCGAMPA